MLGCTGVRLISITEEQNNNYISTILQYRNTIYCVIHQNMYRGNYVPVFFKYGGVCSSVPLNVRHDLAVRFTAYVPAAYAFKHRVIITTTVFG